MEEGGGGRGSLGPASKRQFRGQRTETPSHPGGVNEDVVGRCRLAVSTPELKAPMVSALEATIR